MISSLTPAVAEFASALLRLSDENLAAPWRGEPAPGLWQHYADNPREFYFQVYLELRQYAAQVRVQRATHGPPISYAQEAMARHHAAYLDLRGLLLGVGDDELDQVPAEGEWPLRTVLEHIMRAEYGFFSQIEHAVERWRAGAEPARIGKEEWLARYGPVPDVEGTLHEIMARYDGVHERALRACVDVTAEGMRALSIWWEGEPVESGFRMFRFDAHLREHTIQAEKTLDGIGRRPPEAERLARLLYGALADAESALFGSGESMLEERHTLERRLVLLASALAQHAS
jgi:hypothetical protein